MHFFDSYLEDIKLNRLFCKHNNENLSKIVNKCDENGRTLLHWAAFHGNSNALTILLQNGANPKLASENDECFQAIHFCVVNNHTDCIQILLDYGVSIESCDMFRRTSLCIAAFYGRIIVSMFLLSKQAHIYHQDMNGNNALHFAALSGNTDLCQIFLYSGIDVCEKNDFGETALHLASKRGSKRLLKLLISSNLQLLTQPDDKGINALGHAKYSHNWAGIKYLQNQMNKNQRINLKTKIADLMYGRGRSKWALVYFITMVYFVAVPIYVRKIVFVTYSDYQILNSLLICDWLIMTLLLYCVKSTEPGFLPRFTKEYDVLMKSILIRQKNEAGLMEFFSRLCHTCRTVKPLRASHCHTCGRCVREKDRHCPYIHNCIGYGNRQFFLGFLLSIWMALGSGLLLYCILILQYQYTFEIYERIGFAVVMVYFVFVSIMIVSTIAGAWNNITTNESRKWKRYGYEYLRDDHGRFRNSFHKGAFINILWFFRIVIEFRTSSPQTIDV